MKQLIARGVLTERGRGAYVYTPGFIQQPENIELVDRGMRYTMQFMNDCVRLGLIQWVGGGAAGVVVAIGTTLLARSFTLSDQIAVLTERTAVTEQKVATLQIDFQDVRNEVRTANDRLTELRLIVGNIAVKLDVMPQHLPLPRKPGEP